MGNKSQTIRLQQAIKTQLCRGIKISFCEIGAPCWT